MIPQPTADNVASFVNLGGETVALLLAPPNRRTKPKITPEFPAEVTWHPLSKRQSPRIFAHSARYQMQYLVTLRNAGLCTAFAMWLQRLKDEQVVVPVWDDVCVLTAAKAAGQTILPLDTHPARSGADWLLLAPDFSAYEFV